MKFEYLNGLRGLAAFFVLLHHYVFIFFPYAVIGEGLKSYWVEMIYQTPLYILVAGDFAVCIFFVLSGIVLSAKFFRTGDTNAVIATAAKRYFRLGIPVFISILIGYVLLRLGLFFNNEAAALTGSTWWGGFWQKSPDLLAAITQGIKVLFTIDNTDYNFPLWTMKIEFLGSFLVFMTILLFGKLRHRWIPYLFLVVFFIDTYYLAFLLGIIICDYYFSVPTSRLRSWLTAGWWLPLLLVSLILGSWPLGDAHGTLFAALPDSLSSITRILSSFGLIVALMSSKMIQTFFETVVLQFLGRISFSLYLLHALILGTYSSYLVSILPRSMDLGLKAIIVFVPTVILTLCISYIYAKYVDESAIKFSGYAYRRWFLKAR